MRDHFHSQVYLGQKKLAELRVLLLLLLLLDELSRRFEAIKPGTLISPHPLSRAAIQWATSNLESCITSHTSCASNLCVQLPRRVLTFCKLENGAITVKLQENKEVYGRYIALSHCWGATQSCTTTTQNLSDRMRSIAWDELPKTFQDSIVYSLELGVNHLWIDALCILQDLLEDWQIESAKMAEIYRKSSVTLAATASENGQGGCFSSKYASSRSEYQLQASSSPTGSIMVREKIAHWVLPPNAATLQHHPLLTRGWTFQERILSPRVIHFCSRELVFECKHRTICECQGLSTTLNPMSQFSQVIMGYSGEPSTTKITAGSQYGAKIDPTLISEQWHRIVEEYSALSLTKELDRLPALSGLAQRASSILGNYVAGLWSATLLSDLMWRVSRLDSKHGRPATYTGPTYSWASVTGPVTYWTDLQLDSMLQNITWFKSMQHLEMDHPKGNYRSNFFERALGRAGTVEPASSCTSVPDPQLPLELPKFTFHPVGHLITPDSRNLFGTVSSGCLVLARHIFPARLKYSWTRQGFGSNDGVRRIDPEKYDLEIGHIELPFFADYILCEEGEHHLEDDKPLYIMAMHPNVCLVLKKTADVKNSVLGMEEITSNDLLIPTYERVGIIRQPAAFLNTYLLDWMPQARVELLMIH